MENLLKDLEAAKVYPSDEKTRIEWESWVNESMTIMHDCMHRQFIVPAPEEKRYFLRVSQLGSPAIELLCRKFTPKEEGKDVPEKVRRIFYTGDLFEAYVVFSLRRIGYKIIEYQPEVIWYPHTDIVGKSHPGLSGHPDIVVECPKGNRYILEIKTANDRYFNSVSRYGVDDERGYLTQVSCYSEAMDLSPVFLFTNKNTGEITVEFVKEESIREHTERASKIITYIDKCKTFADGFKYFLPPEAEPEFQWWNEDTQKFYRLKPKDKKCSKKPTGRYLVPYSMKYSPFKRDIYELYTLSGVEYIKDYKYPTKHLKLKPPLP